MHVSLNLYGYSLNHVYLEILSHRGMRCSAVVMAEGGETWRFESGYRSSTKYEVNISLLRRSHPPPAAKIYLLEPPH